MAGNTICQIPPNLEDNTSTKRFLNRLVENIDIAFGYRGDKPITSYNPKQGAVKDITIPETPSVDDLKSVEEKINEILKVLRGSNIISD